MDPKFYTIFTSKLEDATALMHAISHKLRIVILNYIINNPGTHVGDIYKTLNIEQSACSQHLKILRDTNLVHSERVGKNVQYYYNEDLIRNISICIDKYLVKDSN